MDKQTILASLDIRSFYASELPSIKLNGSDKAQARCPFHEDNNPSLSVTLSSGGFNCFACSSKGSIFDFYMKRYGVDFKAAKDALAEKAGIAAEQKRKIVATYDYTDEAGNILFQTVRYDPKDFKQRRLDGNGGWIYNLKDTRLVPYNLPEVLKAKSLIIVEGEKDVESLRDITLIASSSPMGAGKWKRAYNEYFKGKRVVMVPDNDELGRKHGLQVAENLKGVAESVKIVSLPGLPNKGDLSDWIQAGGTKEQLVELIKNTPEWEPSKEPTPGLVRLDTVTPETVEWLWNGYIPLGKVTLLDGDPGNGKSLVSLDLVARCSSGRPMPDGSRGIHGGAVIMALEDGLADTIVPRLLIAGGNPKKVVSLQGVPDDKGGLRFPTVEDVGYIARACKEVDARLVIIDPVMAHLGDTNSFKDQDIRAAMTPLVQMAEKEDVAILIIRHLNKSQSSSSMYRGGGSIGFIGLARVGLLIAKDPEDEDNRIMAGIKSNLGPLPSSLSYTIENIEGVPRIAWGGISAHTADALLSIPGTPEEKSALDEAKDFLRDLLAGGALPAKEVYKQGKEAGISERTLYRARKPAGVKSEKGEFGGGWKWSLLDEDCQKVPKITKQKYGNLGESLAILAENELSDSEGKDEVIEVIG